MSIKKKVAYLQGLAEGLDVGKTDDGKLFTAIIDALAEISGELDELNENALDLAEEIDALSDDLADVEDFLEDFGFDDDFELCDDDDDDDWDYDDDDDDWDDCDDDCDCCNCCPNAEFSLDVNCTECNAEIELSENDIASESVTCPACNKLIELEFDEIDVDVDEPEDDDGDK
ncbi:MAG: hypothetical protein FWH17_09630 [Oscillospiraceae bacterium]|nr:hypothetical protein [Oscillospiraceae bacterium]